MESVVTRSLPAVVQADLEAICGRLEDEFQSLSGNNLLITGGGGFLGYYLVLSALWWNRTKSSGAPVKVLVLDNFFRGVPQWLRDMPAADDFAYLQHNIMHDLPEMVERLDYVMHAASIASPTYYREYPIQTMDANVTGWRQLLDRCVLQQAQGVPLGGVLFFSTSEIYGDPPPEWIPTPENYRGNVSCTGPRACYDESKRFGETLAVNFARQYDLPIKIVRPFNNYGPGLSLDDRRVAADFPRCVLAGTDLVMHSDGSPTRTFCYVADAVIGFYKALVRGRSVEAYNIGADSPQVSVSEFGSHLIRVAQRLFGYGGKIVHQISDDRDYLSDNPARRCPDITKAREELGFSAQTTLEEGLSRTLQWYKALENEGRAA